MNPIILLLYILPKNLISYLTGVLVRVKLPRRIQFWINQRFVKLFKIDMSEAEKTLKEYRTIEDVFTRALKEDIRPIQSEFCSPCDGTLAMAGPIEGDTAIQAKGHLYDASELVTGTSRAAHMSTLRHFVTLYLAPHNYHRVHSPVAGKILNIYYLPGELWPVNDMSIQNVPKVFTRNERLSFEIETENGGRCFLVMVGAFNVGRMRSPFIENFHSNDSFFKPGRYRHLELQEPQAIAIGEEIGTFMLGSTVVLVLDQTFVSKHKPVTNSQPKNIKLGESILV
jgi:phosphatidylserine decarboxylase